MNTIAALINNPQVDIFFRCIADGDIKIRKAFVLLARHMKLPIGIGNFYRLTFPAVEVLYEAFSKAYPPGSMDPVTIAANTSSTRNRIDNILSHPLYAGAIIMAAFIAPITDAMEQQIKLDAYMKEINIMDLDPYLPDLDFRCFFGDYDIPLHSKMTANPTAAKDVHEAIQNWSFRHSTSHRPHRPKLSSKLLPFKTRASIDIYCDMMLHDPTEATQADLEYLWMRYQIEMEGPCEIKQRWYTNGLAPRTYFVTGPSLYNSSKYTQGLWNDLVDSLTTTHRRARTNVSRIHIDGVSHALFYDLSVFTSNCAVQKEFLSALALYVDGMEFYVEDMRYGTHPVDFGDVVRDYCNTNIHPRYTGGHDLSLLENVHGVAGFLGVYGNIATCTFIHGAFLLQLASGDSSGECGCAGDDAVIVVHDDDDDTIWACLSLIGVLAPEKTFSSVDPDVVYLKRRVWFPDRRPCNLKSSRYIQLPSFLFTMPKNQLNRYRERKSTKPELKELAAKSISATFKSAVGISSQQLADTREFLRRYYDLLNVPHSGNVPQFTDKDGFRYRSFFPSIECLGHREWIIGTIQSLYPGWSRIPCRDPITILGPMEIRAGNVYRVGNVATASLLEKMGILERAPLEYRLIEDSEGLEATIAEYTGVRKHEDYRKYRAVHDLYEDDDTQFPVLLGQYDYTAPHRELVGALDCKLTLCAERRSDLSRPRYRFEGCTLVK